MWTGVVWDGSNSKDTNTTTEKAILVTAPQWTTELSRVTRALSSVGAAIHALAGRRVMEGSMSAITRTSSAGCFAFSRAA